MTNNTALHTFTFRQPMRGADIIVCLKKHMQASWYQGRSIKVQVGEEVHELFDPSSIPGLRLESRAGTSDLINPVELYNFILVPKDYLYLFVLKPDEW